MMFTDPLLTFENLCVALLFEENAIEKDIQHVQYWDERKLISILM